MENVNLTEIAGRLASLESHIDQRFASLERLQYWTLGIVGGFFLTLLAGTFAIFAALLAGN